MLHKRPPLPARFGTFEKIKQSLRQMESVYARTQDDEMLGFISIQREVLRFFEEHEAIFREMEIEQAMGMFKDLPHSVRTWLMYYREQEMTL